MMHNMQGNDFSISLPTFIIALTICLPFVVVSSQCNNSNRAVIFNFGDSNSDTGGLTGGLGSDFGYPHGRAFFRRPTGRLTDGRLVIDFFCEYLDTHYLSPYLDSLEPNFTNGVNFAVCGATTLPSNVPFNLGIQIRQFKHFHNRSIHLTFKGATNLVGEEDFSNALYLFDIGQNDLTLSFKSLSYAQVIERIPSFISEIRDAILAIYRLGGKNFWVHNTGPLGCLATQIALRSKANGSDYDQYGCIKSLNEASKAFNTELSALSEQLRAQMESSTIVYVDVYSIKYDLIANSSSYGFKDPLMACCESCLSSGYTVCDEGARYISWDGTHYSEAANAFVALKILSTHYSSPPLEFNFFCNNDYRVSSS